MNKQLVRITYKFEERAREMSGGPSGTTAWRSSWRRGLRVRQGPVRPLQTAEAVRAFSGRAGFRGSHPHAEATGARTAKARTLSRSSSLPAIRLLKAPRTRKVLLNRRMAGQPSALAFRRVISPGSDIPARSWPTSLPPSSPPPSAPAP